MLDPEMLEAIVLGAVQGIAEFLPISSSGHLIILQVPLSHLLGTDTEGSRLLRLSIALHFGTLLSILTVYRHELRTILRRTRLCVAIVVATIPAGVVGLIFKDWIEHNLQTPLVAGLGLAVTAVLLTVGQRAGTERITHDELNWVQALVIGLFQAVAITPGISRSGSTISGGLLVGLQRDSAAAFSFLIAIPIIGGAALLESLDTIQESLPPESLWPLCVGMIISYVTGLLALRGLLSLIQRNRLYWFAWYCALASAVTLGWQFAS